MKQPELVSATQEQLDEILALAKTSLPTEHYERLEGVLDTFVYLMRALQSAKTSLRRFRRMLFGASTESKRNVLGSGVGSGVGSGDKSPDAAGASALEGTPTEAEHEAKPGAPTPAAPRRGHGRNGADSYCDSPVIDVAVPDLRSGDPCPECSEGKVYDAPPKTLVKVVGRPPLTATLYKRQQLRCRLCDATFSAPLPEGTSSSKYDHSCASMLAVLRYGSGMPFYRLEGLQGSLNVPLSDATQWDIVANAVSAPRAVFGELTRQAAQGDLLHNDDTPARILSLINERTRLEAAGQTPEARAINTSAIVAVLPQERRVMLFFTGHRHAGQNLADVLALRAQELGPPIQMSDALAANFVGTFQTLVAKCLTHGRRKFVDVMEHFPQPCRYVINVLAKVYANDAHCRDETMSPEQRLLYHQAHSATLMQELLRWMNEQLDQRTVEPNSGLGQALRYLIKHWSGLTLFLHQAGAPLDNNVCERALKRAILHRKNSMFYKTTHGAEVGDIYMSLIHTCQLCRANPFEYLQALQIHAEDVQARTAQWLPWNYREQLTRAA